MDGKWLGHGLAVITFKSLKSSNLKTLSLQPLNPSIPRVFKSETLRISKFLEFGNLNIYSSDLQEREVTETLMSLNLQMLKSYNMKLLNSQNLKISES